MVLYWPFKSYTIEGTTKKLKIKSNVRSNVYGLYYDVALANFNTLKMQNETEANEMHGIACLKLAEN